MTDPIINTPPTEASVRDAIHIAIMPAIAERNMRPGDHVGVTGKRGNDYLVETECNTIGIINPFAVGSINKGERIWVMLYPGTIQSLRHDWTHTEIDAITSRPYPQLSDEEYRRLEQIASNCGGLTVQELIDAAQNYQQTGDYLSEGGRFEGCYVGEDFWRLYDLITGSRAIDRHSFFSCSC